MQIPRCIEQRMRIIPPGPANGQIVIERLQSARSRIGILLRIPLRIEQRVWASAFRCSYLKIVLQCTLSICLNIGVLLQVPGGIKEAGERTLAHILDRARHRDSLLEALVRRRAHEAELLELVKKLLADALRAGGLVSGQLLREAEAVLPR